jgi:WD40 repeat protein
LDSYGALRRGVELPGGIRKLIWLDEKALAVGFNDARLFVIWDDMMQTEPPQAFPGHSDWILDLDVVPGAQGNGLVSISKDGTIRHWPVESLLGEVVIDDRRHVIAAPRASDFLSGDRRAAGLPEIHQVDGYEFFEVPRAECCRFLAEGSCLLMTEEVEGTRRYVNRSVTTGQTLWTFPVLDPNDPVVADSKRQSAFLAMNRSDVWVVDVPTGHCEAVLKHPNAIRSIQTSPQHPVLAVGCLGGAIRIWNTDANQLIRQLDAHRNSILHLAFSQDGAFLASSGEDRIVRLWRTSDWKELDAIGLSSEVHYVSFLDDDLTLFLQESEQLVFWSIPERVELLRWPVRPHAWRAAVSPDRSTIAIQIGGRLRLLRGAP